MTRNSPPTVSVIVPVYNKAEYLRDSLDSALSQSLSNIEVIVIDDGSEDGTLEIAQSFASSDERVRVVSQRNAGVAAARNQGLALAQGSYVAFLDPDDWYPDSDVLRNLVDAAILHDVMIAGGSAERFVRGERSQTFPEAEAGYQFQADDVFEYASYQYDYGFWRFIYNRAFLIENGILFPPYRRYQDPPFFVRAMSLAGSFAGLKRSTYVYRVAQGTNWQASRVTDVMRGMIDVLRLAAEMGYHALAERTIRRFNSAHIQAALLVTLDSAPERVLPLLDTLTDLSTRVGSLWRGTPKVAFGRAEELADIIDISVIVPVYNSAQWLHECLLSVLGQTGVQLEVICVDDGSSDDSIRILREYQQLDPRVHIIEQSNSGLSVARNAGIEAARGRYLCFLDSDDYWRVDGISTLVGRADEEQLDLLQYDAVPFADHGVSEASWKQYANYYKRSHEQKIPLIGAELIAAQLASHDYKPSACLYLVRRSHLEANSLHFIPGMTHEDNPFTFSALINTERAAHVAIDLYARRVRPSSIMTSDSMEASMRGYFLSYVHMHREAMRHAFSPEVENAISDLLIRIFNNVISRFNQVDPPARSALKELATSADSRIAYSMLQKVHQLSTPKS